MIKAATFQSRFPGGVGVLASGVAARATLSEIAPVGSVFFLVFSADGIRVWTDPTGSTEIVAVPWSAVGEVALVGPEDLDPLDRSFTSDLLGLSFDHNGSPLQLQVEVRRGLSASIDASMNAFDLAQLVRKIDALRALTQDSAGSSNAQN